MLGKYIKGWFFWHIIKIKYFITYRKVVIVLSDENRTLDGCVLKYLDKYMHRKHANKAIVFCKETCFEEWYNLLENKADVSAAVLTDQQMDLLYSFFCYMKFFDNVVFTNIDTPSDNLLGRFLRETEVNEVDATFLALFHLRYVPAMDVEDNEINV